MSKSLAILEADRKDREERAGALDAEWEADEDAGAGDDAAEDAADAQGAATATGEDADGEMRD